LLGLRHTRRSLPRMVPTSIHCKFGECVHIIFFADKITSCRSHQPVILLFFFVRVLDLPSVVDAGYYICSRPVAIDVSGLFLVSLVHKANLFILKYQKVPSNKGGCLAALSYILSWFSISIINLA
jgi:hypothetical protein